MRLFRSCTLAFSMVLAFTSTNASAERSDRPCSESDLLGTWTLAVSKHRGEIPDSAKDLLEPFQIRVYGPKRDFRQLSSNRELTKEQAAKLLSIPQDQTFRVNEGSGIVSTVDKNGTVLEEYLCAYFFADFPEGKIKKGTLSLLWVKNDEPSILNTYTKLDLGD